MNYEFYLDKRIIEMYINEFGYEKEKAIKKN